MHVLLQLKKKIQCDDLTSLEYLHELHPAFYTTNISIVICTMVFCLSIPTSIYFDGQDTHTVLKRIAFVEKILCHLKF